MALRFDIGFDYQTYYSLLFPYPDDLALERIEPGSRLIIEFARQLNYPPIMFIIFSVITYGIVFYTLNNYTKNTFLSALTYFSFLFFVSIGGIRQGLAIAIILWGIHYLNQYKYFKFTLTVCVATLFHYSAITAITLLPLFLTIRRKTVVPVLLFTSIAIFFGYYAIVNKFFPYYLVYIENNGQYEGGTLIKFALLGLNILLLFFCFKTINQNNYKWAGISLLGCLFPFILGGQMGNRVAYYFYTCLCYLIPSLFDKQYHQTRKLLVCALCIYFMLLVYIDTFNPIKSSYTPYQTILTIDTDNPHWK